MNYWTPHHWELWGRHAIGQGLFESVDVSFFIDVQEVNYRTLNTWSTLSSILTAAWGPVYL